HQRVENKDTSLDARPHIDQGPAVVPLTVAWRTMLTLVATLDTAADKIDVRLKLRAAIRRNIDSIWLLVTARGRDRFCAAQVFFSGSMSPQMVYILHRPPRSNVRSGNGKRSHVPK